MNKTVNIIGSGISGLTAGCYLQMCGFKTQIFEKHSNSGGLCTSWQRKGYTINFSAHWIIGSDVGSSFYKMWSELIDMQSINFVNHELKIDIQLNNNVNKYGDNTFHFYTDLEKFKNYLLDLSPIDKPIIQRFIKRIKLLQKYDLPPIKKKQPFLLSVIDGVKMAKYLEIVPVVIKWSRETNVEFAQKFKDPFLNESFKLLYENDIVKMLVLAIPLAYFDKKSAGYPIGGSISFTNKLEERYIELGGKINYNADVKNIEITNNKTTGIRLNNNEIIKSDIVLSTADWYHTFFNLIDEKYRNKQCNELVKLKKYKVFFSSMLFSYGVKIDLGNLPHYFSIPLKKEIISPDGEIYKRIEIRIINFDESIVPKGHSLIAINLYTQNGEYWINLRKLDYKKYCSEKEEFSSKIIDAIEQKIKNVKSNIDMIDIATPATIMRYTNNWKGSTQGWLPGKKFLSSSSCNFEYKEIKNFYYSSHWSTPGGGLPVVIKNSREVTQLICKRNNVKFVF